MDKSAFFDVDLLSLISLYIGLINLEENRQQSAHNDVEAANTQQAHYLLDELGKKFDEQNQMLKRILEVIEHENAA